MLKTFCLFFIRIYQKTLSPDHGVMRFFLPRGGCIYRPTCSDYAYQAIKKFGLAKGSFLAAKRLARCHPWSAGGHDPINNNI
ncbi:MAG: membrane protein insertion efficiency factor YidD [Candidatus Komeilibacteria bacterium]|nr:membrane protein insertion efficiency factor YidD [Candidatus Komeilibacteria bacterium]